MAYSLFFVAGCAGVCKIESSRAESMIEPAVQIVCPTDIPAIRPEICINVAMQDHGLIIAFRAVNKDVRARLDRLVDVGASLESLLQRGDINSLLTRSDEFVPFDLVRPGCAIKLLSVRMVPTWLMVSAKYPRVFAWMKNVIGRYLPKEVNCVGTAMQPDKIRAELRVSLVLSYMGLVSYCLFRGNLQLYRQFDRIGHDFDPSDSDDDSMEENDIFADLKRTRQLYYSGQEEDVPERRYFEVGAYIMLRYPDVANHARSVWGYGDDFIACCEEINSESCKI